jgi:predicted dehydrogenase
MRETKTCMGNDMNPKSCRTGLSRRTFLQRSSLLLTGAALPQILPSGVLAAEGRPGANDRIGIGFIGMGRRANDLIRILSMCPEARCVAIADVNLTRARGTASKHNAVAFQDYRRLLERKDVDGIITATPEHWRLLICVESCQAGKDVYVEKPMTLTIREGRLIVQAARKYKRVFQVGSQQRSMWQNYAGCKLIRTGGLGKITKVLAYNYPSPWNNHLPAQPIPDGLNWDMWCGPVEPVPYNQDLYLPRANPGWLSFRSYSGGEMTGWGAHGFDQVQWALGMDETGPVEVWTEGPKYIPPTYDRPESRTRGDKISTETKIFFRYANGVVVEPDPDNRNMGGATFFGEKGKVIINRGVFDSDPEELAIDALRKRPADFNDNHMKNWLDCIKSRTKPVADVETGHRSATMCHLGNIARWTGRKLHWNPVKEQFVGDPKANQYLDRERRKPWVAPEKI